jgi:hypothetical protein
MVVTAIGHCIGCCISSLRQLILCAASCGLEARKTGDENERTKGAEGRQSSSPRRDCEQGAAMVNMCEYGVVSPLHAHTFLTRAAHAQLQPVCAQLSPCMTYALSRVPESRRL